MASHEAQTKKTICGGGGPFNVAYRAILRRQQYMHDICCRFGSSLLLCSEFSRFRCFLFVMCTCLDSPTGRRMLGDMASEVEEGAPGVEYKGFVTIGVPQKIKGVLQSQPASLAP